MAKQIVDKSGFVVLGADATHGDSLFDGTQVKQATLTLTTKTAVAQAIGEGYADEAVVSRSYEISGTAYSGGDSFFSVGDTCHATYYTQVGSTLTTKLFEGDVVVTRASDHQTQGEYETQEITLRSTGAPTVPS